MVCLMGVAGRIWLGVIAIIAASNCATVVADVTVDKKPPVVMRRPFDPAHPPAEMPPMQPGEAAVTQSQFDCSINLTYTVIGRKTTATGQCTTSLQVKGVAVNLELKTTVWLPTAAPAKLAAHEEGHRQIDERIYADADKAAREIGTALDGEVLEGEGADCAAAESSATRSAADRLCRDYLRRVAGRAGRVGEIYDQITAHGTRAKPAEREAIQQAFAREAEQNKGSQSAPN